MTEKKKRLSPLEAIEAQINASKERLEQLKKKENGCPRCSKSTIP